MAKCMCDSCYGQILNAIFHGVRWSSYPEFDDKNERRKTDCIKSIIWLQCRCLALHVRGTNGWESHIHLDGDSVVCGHDKEDKCLYLQHPAHTIYNEVSTDSLVKRFHSLFRRDVYAKRWNKLTEHWICYESAQRKLFVRVFIHKVSECWSLVRLMLLPLRLRIISVHSFSCSNFWFRADAGHFGEIYHKWPVGNGQMSAMRIKIKFIQDFETYGPWIMRNNSLFSRDILCPKCRTHLVCCGCCDFMNECMEIKWTWIVRERVQWFWVTFWLFNIS